MSARVEAAMAALGESYGEDAHCREVEYVQTTLAAADAVMFSEAAIERAVESALENDRTWCECRSSPLDKHDVNPPCSTRSYIDSVARAVVAALREEA